jgi:hypothetical protein
MDETIEDRLAAVERALTDGDHDLDALAADAETAARVDRLEDDIAMLRERVDELDAATQALRGYVGNVRAVNEDVRERADLALELAERGGRSHAADEPTVGSAPEEPTETQSDSQSRSDSQTQTDEPKLELPTDDPERHSPGNDTERGRATGRCPLCEEQSDRHPSSDQLPSDASGGDSARSDSTRTGSRTSTDRRGVTDGGATDSGPTGRFADELPDTDLVESDESSDGDDGSVLRSIRDML